ncbi:HNH endonuclease family protein [Arcanobacterium bovis]|uniref:HNH endonuclease n=1 Tax=Arcanobacterium bovis TaxID=2529275 RepID=A0A4Q9UYV9_9ACTO|nr:HNH endonuclease family protein [Arcanobacterium bovis]TBW20799.1 HNH endonuclease [Arcanobacterium bovis]
MTILRGKSRDTKRVIRGLGSVTAVCALMSFTLVEPVSATETRAMDLSSRSVVRTVETSAELDAATALDQLQVKGRAPKTGYKRTEFGTAWTDVDHNGCDTRNDILKRDLTRVVFTSGRGGECVVQSGRLISPYNGEIINFEKGTGSSGLVPIDHVVALSDAWQTGAQQISVESRTALANDPLNLIAVDRASNTKKSDSNAASWLPSYKPFRCEYVARQIAVKTKYELWVTESEKEAMKRVLSTCPGQKLPSQPPYRVETVIKERSVGVRDHSAWDVNEYAKTA